MFRRPAPFVFFALALVPALPAADATMLNLVMPDAKVIMGADVDRLTNSPFGQHILSLMKLEGKEFESFVAMTGFDPRRDLREVLVASQSVEGNMGSDSVAIVRGAFDEAKLTALATVNGGVVSSYNGVKLLTGPPKPGHAGPTGGYLGGGYLVVGQDAPVKAAIDRQRAAKPLDAALAARIQASSGQYHAWVVTTASPSELAGRVRNPNMAGAMKGDLLQAIESISAGVRFGANVEVGGEANTRSDRDATALIDVMRFLVSMATSNAPPAFGKIAESLQLTSEGATVRFSASIPEADFEKLFQPRRRTTTAMR
jgi:hypothetical protein